MGAFADYPGYKDTKLEFTITNVWSPRVSQLSPEFIIESQDSLGYVIDQNIIYNMPPLSTE